MYLVTYRSMYVYMCAMHMLVCIYVYMYAYMDVGMYVCVYCVCMFVCIHAQLSRPMMSRNYFLDSGRPRQHTCVDDYKNACLLKDT